MSVCQSWLVLLPDLPLDGLIIVCMSDLFISVSVSSLSSLSTHRSLSSSHIFDTFSTSDDGRLFSWGSNVFGQLGLGETSVDIKSCSEPQPVIVGASHCVVTHVACGLRHSIIATNEGRVMTCGAGRKGQLGHLAIVQNESSDSRIGKSIKCKNMDKHYGFARVDVGESNAVDGRTAEDYVLKNKVLKVIGGSFHSGVLFGTMSPPLGQDEKSKTECSRPDLYLWGCNKYGQLGRSASGPSALSSSSKPLLFDQSAISAEVDEIEGIASGWTHLIAKTKGGKLFRLGYVFDY